MKNKMIKISYVFVLMSLIALPILPSDAQTGYYYNQNRFPDNLLVNTGNYQFPTVPTQNYYYNDNYNNYDYSYHRYYRYEAPRPQPRYTFQWMNTGRNIVQTGRYVYEMTGQTTNFNSNENVYAMTKITGIDGINHFQVKHSLYYSNGNYYRELAGSVNYPTYYWEYNYTWSNFGKLPAGSYEIRSYISLNSGSFVELSRKSITINDYNYLRKQNRNYSNRNYNYKEYNNKNNNYQPSTYYEPSNRDYYRPQINDQGYDVYRPINAQPQYSYGGGGYDGRILASNYYGNY